MTIIDSDSNGIQRVGEFTNLSSGRSVTWFAAMAFVILSGCERSGNPANDTNSEPDAILNSGTQDTSSDGSGKSEVETLTILAWENYLVPDLLKRFEKENHVRIEVQVAENSAQLVQTLESNPRDFDLIIVDDQSVKGLVELRLIGELDHSKLPEFPNLAEDFVDLDFDPENRYSAPYLWGTTVLVYRRDRIHNPDLSWNLLWREDLNGRVAFLDEPLDMFSIAVLALGGKPEVADSNQVDAAAELLVKGMSAQRGSMIDYLTALDQLKSGEKDVVISYNGDAIVQAISDPEIEVVIPREGAPLWLDSFVISRDCSRQDLAHRFINFMLSAEAAAESANELKYASPNLAARHLIDPILLQNKALYPGTALMKLCRFVRFPPECNQAIQHGFKRVFDEARKSEEFTPMLNRHEHGKMLPSDIDPLAERDEFLEAAHSVGSHFESADAQP